MLVAPLYAETTDIAHKIFSILMMNVPPGAKVSMFVNCQNQQAVDLIKDQKDKEVQFKTVRMWTSLPENLEGNEDLMNQR